MSSDKRPLSSCMRLGDAKQCVAGGTASMVPISQAIPQKHVQMPMSVLARPERMQRAQAEGLTQGSPPFQSAVATTGFSDWWYCPFCPQYIHFDNLTDHLDSSQHCARRLGHQGQSVEQQHRSERDLPLYLEYHGDDWIWCICCECYWDDRHDATEKHCIKRDWFLAERCADKNIFSGNAAKIAVPAATDQVTLTNGLAATRFVGSNDDVPPRSWGDPRAFTYNPKQGKLFCWICWMYADDSHIRSKKHTQRAPYTIEYLRNFWGVVVRGNGPPTGTLSLRPEVIQAIESWPKPFVDDRVSHATPIGYGSRLPRDPERLQSDNSNEFLAPGWKQATCGKSGKPYYYRVGLDGQATGRVTWEKPSVRAYTRNRYLTVQQPIERVAPAKDATTLPCTDDLPAGWKSCVEQATGKTYYYQVDADGRIPPLGVTQWNRPTASSITAIAEVVSSRGVAFPAGCSQDGLNVTFPSASVEPRCLYHQPA